MMDLLKFKFSAEDATGSAFAAVRGQLRGVDGALASVQERVTRMGRSMRNIGAGMTAGVTAPLVLLGRQSLMLYDAQVSAEAAVRTAIESTGGAARLTAQDLGDMASKLQGLTTYGDEDILQNVTAQLLTFTQVQGKTFERAQSTILDMSTLLGTDLSSSAIMVGKALNDPIAGISALSRVGVTFSDAQKDVIASLVETGDVAGAQAVILSNLETQFQGQAAAAVSTPLGQWAQLSNAIGDVKEQLGGQIAPFLAPLVETVSEAVAWFSELSPEIKRNIVIFGGLAAALGPVLAVLGQMTMGLGFVAGAFGVLGAVITANPIIAAIAAIAAGAYLIYNNWDFLVDWFSGLWGELSAGAASGWASIKSILDEFTPQWLQDLWIGLVDFYVDLWVGIYHTIVAGWDLIKALFASDYSPVKLVQEAWGGLGAWFTSMWPEVSATFTEFWDGVVAMLAGWPAQFLQAGRDMINAMIAGIRERLPFLKALQDDIGANVASSIGGSLGIGAGGDVGANSAEHNAALLEMYGQGAGLGGALEEGARSALEIRSPSRVFASIGGDVMAGMSAGIKGGLGETLEAVEGAGVAMGETMQNFPFADKMAGWIMSSQNAGDVFKSVLADMGANLLKFAMNSAWSGVAENIANMQTGGSGGAGGFFAQVLGAAFGVPAAGATGGATATTNASGGVFSSPIAFNTSGGLNSMAENGPEAIMPLTRIGGKLGVLASGGGGGSGAVQISQVFHINVEGGGGDETPERLVAALRPVMREEASKVFSRARRERVA
jgi:hypothetical protein